MNISPVSNNIYGQIASGNRLTSAAVSPAESAISEKMQANASGLEKGGSNTKSGISALNISDGALSGISDSLQRIQELSIQASSGLMSGSDKKAIQSEISGLLQGIDSIANNTQYNSKNLLNNTDSMNIASNPDGSGVSVKNVNSTVKALGLDGYDVTGNFDISKVSDAISMVSSQRSSIGTTTNALESSYRQNSIAMENVLSSKSKISDLDIPTAVSDMKKKELLNTFQVMMQKRKQEDDVNNQSRLFMAM